MTGAWELFALRVIVVLLDASYVGLPLTVGVMEGFRVKWLY